MRLAEWLANIQKAYVSVLTLLKRLINIQKAKVFILILFEWLCSRIYDPGSMLGRTLSLSRAHTRSEGHLAAVQSTKSTLLLESRFLYT